MRPHTVQAGSLVKVVLELVAQPRLFRTGSDRLSALPTYPCHADVVAAFNQVNKQPDADAEPFTFAFAFGDIPGEVTGILQ